MLNTPLRRAIAHARQFLVSVASLGLAILASTPAAAGLADTFTIALEQAVSNGNPGPGAGNIEVAGATDIYSFTIAAPTTIYADEVSGGCPINWKLVSPSGATIFSDTAICTTDPGVRALTEVGTYVVTVAANGSSTGTYGFVLWELNPPQSFPLTLKSPVSNGVPGPGAGNIEEPGAVDLYTFSIAAPINIFAMETSGGCPIRWSLTAPSGATIFQDTAMCTTPPGARSLTEVGTYTVRVEGTGSATGTYGFVLYELNPPEVFPIQLKSAISAGVPSTGAGVIEEPGALDQYTLTVTEPTMIFVDHLSGNCNLRLSLVAPSGATLVNGSFLCLDASGVVSLDELGSYTVNVQGVNGATGSYGFILYELNDPETFPLAVGDTVSSGVPSIGAGVIEEPGAKDIYLISIDAPKSVYFDQLAGGCALRWNLTAPDGAILFNTFLCLDGGEFELSQIGTYTLTAFGNEAATGSYSFTLVDVNPPELFSIVLEQTVSEGVPAPGAGSIEEAGSVDEYEIAIQAGDEFIPIGLSGSCSLRWSMEAPSGAVIFENAFICTGAPLGLFTAAESGIHRVRVFGSGSAVGTYSFRVLLRDEPQEFVIGIGESVAKGIPGRGAGSLVEPYSIDRYLFSASAGTLVCFQENNGSCVIGWTATTPSGAVLFANDFCGSNPGRFSLPETGVYVITVGGDANDVGSYAFTLEEGSVADISPEGGDCAVNAPDLAVLLGAWGPCSGCAADLNGDGSVDALDLAILLGSWD
jgi:hypothetical protein